MAHDNQVTRLLCRYLFYLSEGREFLECKTISRTLLFDSSFIYVLLNP